MKENWFLIILIALICILSIQTSYETTHPLVLPGKKARKIAIASAGSDVGSPVSDLCGRSPYYIIFDRLKESYKVVPNPYADVQHAAGLKSSQMLVKMNIDAICANNIGLEPARVFKTAHVEMYTDTKSTVLKTFESFPDALVKIDAANVPSHFGITGSHKQVPCNSFDTDANIAHIVQGRYFVCLNCGYKISESNAAGKDVSICPICASALHNVITVTSPLKAGGLKPRVEVF